MKVEILDEDIVWRDLDGDIVILNLATGLYYGLEGAGNDIWRALAEHGSTEKALEALIAAYDVPRPQLERDLDTLVRDFADRGFLKLTGSPASRK